ncbi:hypothetical protein [Hasllibacter sp. MH4015]|uniref:hypothetical protein n=1 Tax=Hasllibacter sp. MH4015 TaxID=2854029 RepID=UPI001CD4B29F|nr:hypothetical protein [Hasllibacter sp. MH4015]
MIALQDRPTDQEAWIEQTFDCPAVRNGGILRTSAHAIKAGAGMDRFVAEVHRRGFRALENNGHVVVFCNRKSVAILRPKDVSAA